MKRIQIRLIELKFNESANFSVHFYKDPESYSMNIMKVEVVKIEGDEYKEWKDDDNYIINLVCQKLGITINDISNDNNDISNETLGITEN